MIKTILCEGGSALIAMVLVVADCRHVSAPVSETAPAITAQSMANSRHLLEVALQGTDAVPGPAGSTGHDVVKQLSGLSALFAPGVGYHKESLPAPRT